MSQEEKVRFLIISDTHNDAKWPPKDRPLPKADVLLHCGDLTMQGSINEYRKTLDMLGNIEAELKLVIAGNHDLSLDKEYRGPHADPEDDKDQAQAMWKGEDARRKGVTYLEEGSYTFQLQNGAKFSLFASPYTPEFCDWGFPYERNQDRFNPAHETPNGNINIASNPIPEGVDIVLTHGPPAHHLGMTKDRIDAGCPHLLRAIRRTKPRLACFGHIHEGWGARVLNWDDEGSATRIKQDRGVFLETGNPAHIDLTSNNGSSTLLVNAAIKNVMYRSSQSPWLIDMMLPKS